MGQPARLFCGLLGAWGTLLMIIGCVPVTSQPVGSPAVSAIEPTPTALIETHVNADWTNVQSRNEDGLAMLGNPDAPHHLYRLFRLFVTQLSRSRAGC